MRTHYNLDRDATLRLKQINLAGFKSFVDPTHIPIPGQLVGIVGPNGCGKSNVIDAVRWVLGETSARHLRGETMQDVLFNGSPTRQPVNRASVELVFDNSLSKAGGPWASYAEISIRRVLERDGEATAYYINNTHVRRRDVADIFLGTGLGSRAYAIIEQGMIGRVIEAKPEELRIFLEEAAGVSRYRERRRETELRLRDTRENLQRVEDIRQELERQLEHLQAQAEVASRYHALQAELRTAQQLLWLLRRREAAALRARHAREVERLTLELEADTARLRETEKRLEEARARHYAAGDAVNAAQGAFYEANAQTARIEQELAHLRETRQRLERERAELLAVLERERGGLAAAQAALAEWREELARARERRASCETAVAAESEKLPIAEEAFRATRARYEESQRALAQAEQGLEVEQTKRDHALELLAQLRARAERLAEERRALQPPDAAQLARLRQEIAAQEQALAGAREALSALERELPCAEERLREREQALEGCAQRIAGLEARWIALRQVQERIAREGDLGAWLAEHGLGASPRLWQGVEIEPGWEDALEAVLRERLAAVAVEAIEPAAPWLGAPPPRRLTLFALAGAPAAPFDAPAGCEPLLRSVRCSDPRFSAAMADWLRGVYVAPDLASALAAREALPAGAVLVTREGHLVARHSVSFHAPDGELHGVLARAREIEELAGALEHARLELQALQREAEEAGARVEEARSRQEALRARIEEDRQRLHALQLQALRLAQAHEEANRRAQQIEAELAEIAAQAQAAEANRAAAERRSAEFESESASARTQLELATDLYERAEAVLRLQREALQKAREEAQSAAFEEKSFESKINEIQALLKVTSENIARSEAALAEREAELARCDETGLQQRLQEALAVRREREQALVGAREALESAAAALKALDEERQQCEQRLEPLRERIAEARLKEQEARLSEEGFARQLAEADAREEELEPQLEKGARAGTLQAEIARLGEEVKALGAVNLAALEELEAARERKSFLDAQSRDLNEAMATLEDAIRRIDRETRERLQRTFDEVNARFAETFPALFGGGHAKLVLTGEEILDAGVQVSAQPPGKRTTTIHLLSGGEKALTALALVFALFQLNPAPFCLLDEVDAPLDDNNTERFCELVKQMSRQSQFIFISHNKITMEIAEQLLGITMQEPGVSRVVAVDIEEAMKLAEEAA